MNIIKVVGASGDTPLQYNPEVAEDMALAVKKFDELKSKGYTLFNVNPETHETEIVDQLFKEHVEVVAIPQISGG